MRELKFKFWLGHTKKMTYEHSLIEISHTAWDFTEDIIPLQYIGLNDKNGKEIYEGDILEFQKEIGKVIFNRSRWEWSYGNEKHEYASFAHYLGESFEVIGNIYENPELLK